jgi:hypothetical protein
VELGPYHSGAREPIASLKPDNAAVPCERWTRRAPVTAKVLTLRKENSDYFNAPLRKSQPGDVVDYSVVGEYLGRRAPAQRWLFNSGHRSA